MRSVALGLHVERVQIGEPEQVAHEVVGDDHLGRVLHGQVGHILVGEFGPRRQARRIVHVPLEGDELERVEHRLVRRLLLVQYGQEAIEAVGRHARLILRRQVVDVRVGDVRAQASLVNAMAAASGVHVTRREWILDQIDAVLDVLRHLFHL